MDEQQRRDLLALDIGFNTIEQLSSSSSTHCDLSKIREDIGIAVSRAKNGDTPPNIQRLNKDVSAFVTAHNVFTNSSLYINVCVTH